MSLDPRGEYLSYHREVRACIACSARQDAKEPVPGVGTVPNDIMILGRNPGCQPAGEVIWTEQGLRSIETVAVGESSAVGSVWDIHQRTAEMIIALKTSAFPKILFTPGHPVLVTDGEARQFQFVHVSDLGHGRKFLVVPLELREEYPLPVRVTYPVNQHDLEPPTIMLNWGRDLMRLIAQYVADGFPGDDVEGPRYVATVFGKRRMPFLSEFESSLQVLGLKSFRQSVRNGIRLTIANKSLASWLVSEFGRGAMGKRLPGWFYRLPTELLYEFLMWYPDGSGHPRSVWRSCNKSLIIGLILTCFKCGIYGRCYSRRAGWGSSNLLYAYKQVENCRAVRRVGDVVLVNCGKKEVIQGETEVYNVSTTSGVYLAPFIAHNSTEDRIGLPFIGPAGQMVDKWLERAGLSRNDVFITNSVLCHTSNNRIPLKIEISTCTKLYLLVTLKFVKPKLVIPMGALAAEAMGIPGSITNESGKVFNHKAGFAVIPVVHPGGVLRKPELRTMLDYAQEVLAAYIRRHRLGPLREEL